ncbi:hypothetical protein [Ramlibacter sp. PS4R-6]|uniref:hypothetical protein n=1 Tax=Ramlibacter sp. PS4R-6 TaxID=3133438 RepID=UPI00309F8779
MTDKNDKPQATRPRRALVAVAAALALVLPPSLYFAYHPFRATATSPAKVSQAQRLAQFGSEPAGKDVRRVANWVAASGDNGTRGFAILDKVGAKVFLFDAQGRLQAAAPALLGAAHGDETVPGIGDKALKDITLEERTTPAGRFIASVGESSSRGEDVVWVDYDAAVSMHRIIKVPERLEAIATPTPDDNRMSYGCINLPDEFYEKALRPAVDRTGVVIYILPETRPLEQTFASFRDVESPTKLAQH